MLSPVARHPDIPDAFDVYTVVVLRRPDDAPDLPDHELESLQGQHLSYRADLRRRGLIAANGPFDEQTDPAYRGMSVFACDLDEAVRLTEGDPSVAAGRLDYDAMLWWVAAGTFDFPSFDGTVGVRRSMD